LLGIDTVIFINLRTQGYKIDLAALPAKINVLFVVVFVDGAASILGKITQYLCGLARYL